MTDKTEMLALLKRAMDKLDCYYKHTAGEYPGGEPNQILFPAIREALAEQPAGAVGDPTIDLDRLFLEACHDAVKANTWMPAEYMANDWQADVLDLLRNGPGTFTTPPAASVDVDGLRALADEQHRHAMRLPATAAKMLRHYADKLRALIDSTGGAKGEWRCACGDVNAANETCGLCHQSTPQPDGGDGAVWPRR